MTQETTPEEMDLIPVPPPRDFVFFSHLVPEELQERLRRMDLLHCPVVWGQLEIEDRMHPNWLLDIQMRTSEEEGDDLLSLLVQDAANVVRGICRTKLLLLNSCTY